MSDPAARLPSVGVIVPNHARIDTLVEAVRSAQAQEYDGEVRVYVVYLERPGAAEVIESLGEGVVPVPTQERGIGAKRHFGLTHTTEQLVAFLDDDDLWHPCKLARQVEALRRSGAVACCTRFLAFSDPVPRWPRSHGTRKVRDLSEREILLSRSIAASSVVVDGRLVRTLGFSDRWQGVEDLHLWIRVAEAGRFVFLDDLLTGIRIQAGSVTSRGTAYLPLLAFDVLADRYRVAGRPRTVAGAILYRVPGLALARADDLEQDAAQLARTLDGTVFGSAYDRLLRRVIEAGWRSRRVAPTLRRARAWAQRTRIERLGSGPADYADAGVLRDAVGGGRIDG